jgi:ADP-ribosylglycohydrolase
MKDLRVIEPLTRSGYLEKTYAGVLGKIIGVYMGRPFEGWTHEAIVGRFGTVRSYVNAELGAPLVVTDDDISGTFTFIRALEDYGYPAEILPEQVSRTWLNYLVEGRTILWWGGKGTSSEHTAYLNLKRGIKAPLSGAAATNGISAANQIGAMIFIDAWAMVAPGDPVRAARLARVAASVSHDQEALNAAAFVAALESFAYVERDIGTLIEAGLSVIPPDSAIAAQVNAMRELRAGKSDWRKAREWVEANHGYDRYPGTCHVVPNFSLFLLALLYGDGDFRESLSIVNTSGWDTDCNAAIIGCLLGIRNGLGAIQACPDLRLAHHDLMYISSADGGRGVTDAAREAVRIANIRFAIEGEARESPKGGSRLSFPFVGALHGFHAVFGEGHARSVSLETRPRFPDENALHVRFEAPLGPALIATPTAKPPLVSDAGSYDFQASPSLYPGQVVKARLGAADRNEESVSVRLFVAACGPGDEPRRHYGPPAVLQPGKQTELSWAVDARGDYPVFELGFEFTSGSAAAHEIWIDRIDWGGVPELSWGRPYPGNTAWKAAWVDAVSVFNAQFRESFRISQNEGKGLVIQGMREWRDYEAAADVALFGADSAGIAVRVQGLRRYYALLIHGKGKVQIVRELEGTTPIFEGDFAIEETKSYELRLAVLGRRLRAWVDGALIADVEDAEPSLDAGAVGLVVEEGTMVCRRVTLKSAGEESAPSISCARS